MADLVVTKQELIDAQKDAQALDDIVNKGPEVHVKTRLGRYVWTLATLEQRSLLQINEWQNAITLITANDGVPALAVSNANGKTQQEINDFGGAEWWNKPGGYKLGASVKLVNGDTVKSTEPNNSTDPNIDMTGWVLVGFEKFDKVSNFGNSTTGTLKRTGTIYESKGTVEKQETRTIFHDYRPTIADGSAFNTDGANLFWGLGAGNFTMKAVPDPEVPAGLDPNLQCSHNVGYGVQALNSITIGYKNVALGNNALRRLEYGHSNVAIGQEASREATYGFSNVSIGISAGFYGNGSYNTNIGANSGYNTQGQGNTNIGRRAGFDYTAGDYNICIGENSGLGVLSGGYNTLIGKQVVNNGITTAANSTIIGSRVTGLENVAGQVVLADGNGVKYFVANPSGSTQAFADVVGREATTVNLTATDAQQDKGSTVKVRNAANSATSFSQVIFQCRVGQPFSRIVQWGGATPKLSIVNNSIESMRIDELGNISQKVNTVGATLSTNGAMTFELTSDSQLKIKVRGNDGVTRSASLTLV